MRVTLALRRARVKPVERGRRLRPVERDRLRPAERGA
jgi:hypothetical protein